MRGSPLRSDRPRTTRPYLKDRCYEYYGVGYIKKELPAPGAESQNFNNIK